MHRAKVVDMTREVARVHGNYIVQEYGKGVSVSIIASRLGTGVDAIYKTLDELGIQRTYVRSGGYASPVADRISADYVLAEYGLGRSMDSLAQAFGCSRKTIARILDRGGVAPRPAGFLLQRPEVREKGALGSQKGLGKSGRFEAELNAMLTQLGEEPVPQRAVGNKNIDVSIEPIAVEIWLSSSNPANDSYCLDRIKYLSDRGWFCLYVWIQRHKRVIDLRMIAQQAILFKKFAESHPPTGREHWVVRGTGDPVALLGSDGNPIPFVPTPIRGSYLSSVDDSVAW